MDVIYKIISPSGKIYIGRTKNFNNRMNEHKQCAKKNSTNSIYKAIRKYGWDNMIKEIICEVASDISQIIEEEFIVAYETVKKGYNDTYNGGGGDVWKGNRDSDEYMEFVAKMKTINKGENNGMYGKKHTEKSIEKLKQKAKGRFSLPWFIERNGEMNGTQLYNERCQKLKNRKLKTDSKGRFIKTI